MDPAMIAALRTLRRHLAGHCVICGKRIWSWQPTRPVLEGEAHYECSITHGER